MAGLAPDEILGDIDKLKSVKYSFVIAIEVCIDIAQHLVSRNAWRAPASFADAFAVLHEAGVLRSRPGDIDAFVRAVAAA